MPAAQVPQPQPFNTVPDVTYQRQFPATHREQIGTEFYPAPPDVIEGDVLEIGPGRGDFLLNEAEAHPEHRFIAIEISQKRYRKLIARVLRRGLSNVQLIYGDGRLVLPRFFRDGSVDSVVILFPDPWPKRRHAFNRLLQPSFLCELGRCLRPGGHLYLKSDVDSYIGWVAQQVSTIPQLQIVEEYWPWEPIRPGEGPSRSLYADRRTRLGYAIHSLCLRRQ